MKLPLPTTIRPATPADYAAMDQLCVAAMRGHGAQVYDADVIEAWVGAAHPQRYRGAVENGTTFYVTVRKGAIVAYGGINLAQARIDALFVDPAFDGDSLGEAMLAFLMRQAREHALASVSVRSTLDAAGFYQRHGFSSVAQEFVDLESGLRLEALMMRKAAGA